MGYNTIDDSFLKRYTDNLFSSSVDLELSFDEYLFLFLKNNDANNSFFQIPDWRVIQEKFFESVYLSDKKSISIISKLFCKLDTDINDITKVITPFFIERKSSTKVKTFIDNYLNTYYKLINTLLDFKIMQQEYFNNSLLRDQIITGYINNIDGEHCNNYYRFYSPVIIEKVRMTYDFTMSFIKGYNKINKDDHEIISIFQHLYLEKVSRLFFMNIIDKNKEQYIYSNDNVKYPILCNRKNISSIMMVKPIRWIDKIRAYVEEYSDDARKYSGDTIKVMVVGYVKLEIIDPKNVESKELNDLSRTLCQLYPDIKFIFDIYYSKYDVYFNALEEKKIELGDKVKFNISDEDYSNIFMPSTLREKIEEHDIILILDSPALYENEVYVQKDNNFIQRKYDELSYKQLYDDLDKESIILPLESRMAPIHRTIAKLNIIRLKRGEEGTSFHYILNTPLVSYVRDIMDQINASVGNRRKDIHILYSSTNSVANSRFALENIAREERYKGKSFRLISFLAHAQNDPGKSLLYVRKGKNKDIYMTFSLWNIIKNMDITLIEDESLINKLGTNKNNIMTDLRFVFVKMMCSPDFRNISYRISIDSRAKHLDKTEIKILVDQLFNAILNYSDTTIGNCILYSFYNVIYSQIQTIDDAVFYCLFRTRNWEIIKPKINFEGEFDDSRPVLSVNQPHRWTVVRAINELQKESFSSEKNAKLIYELKRNNYDADELINNIYRVCERYGYVDSRLFYNISKLYE